MTPPGTPPGDSARADDDGEVGTLAEEAAKLIGALSTGPLPGWAGEQADLGARLDDLASRAADAVRSVSPEVRQHLAAAGRSLVQAAAGLLATAVPDAGAAGPAPEDDEQEEPA